MNCHKDLPTLRQLLGIQAENPLTITGRKLGVVATFKAAWIDPETKREFMARIDVPEDNEIGSRFVAYNKLNPITNLAGSMLPIGKKANISPNKIMQVLTEKKSSVITGQLALGNK